MAEWSREDVTAIVEAVTPQAHWTVGPVWAKRIVDVLFEKGVIAERSDVSS